MKKENFRTWKSGKKWLYASTVLAALAGGAAVGTQVSADVISAANTPGVTGNTATNGASIGTPSLAGVAISDAISTNTNSAAGNTNGSYAANATGVIATSSLGSEIPNLTTAVLTNANGAIQAGSGASSAVSFDVSQTVGIPGSLAIFDGAAGSVEWVITAPTDLASAGLTVTPVSGAIYANSLNDGVTISNGANTTIYVQTVGGSYAAVNYFPNGVTINGSQVNDSLYAGKLSVNGNQSLALVTVSYAFLPEALQSYVNEFLAAPLNLAGSVVNGAGELVSWVGSLAATLTGNNLTVVTDWIQKYGDNIQSAGDALKVAASNLDSQLANISSSVNVLTPVSLNADGTYSVNVNDVSMYNILLNEVNSIINDYLKAVQNVVSGIATIPTIDNTGFPFLDATVISTMNGLIQAWNNTQSYVTSSIENVVQDTISGVDQWFASIASHIFDVNTPGKASVTVGFSAKDPTAQLEKDGIKDGQFAAETFKVEAKNINGDAKNNQVGFTSVVYQYKGDANKPTEPEPTVPGEPGKPETPNKPNRPEKPNKPDIPDKPDWNKPEEPEKPSKPDESVNQDKPVTKPTDDNKKPANNGNSNSNTLPNTGDDSSVALEVLAGTSLLIIGASVAMRKKDF